MSPILYSHNFCLGSKRAGNKSPLPHGAKKNQLQLWQLWMIVFLICVLSSWPSKPFMGGILAQINAEGKTWLLWEDPLKKNKPKREVWFNLSNCDCWWKQMNVCAHVVPERKDSYGWGIPRALRDTQST